MEKHLECGIKKQRICFKAPYVLSLRSMLWNFSDKDRLCNLKEGAILGTGEKKQKIFNNDSVREIKTILYRLPE